MRKRYEPRYDWSWQAAKHIRHPLDRPAVMRELDDHIEDMVEAYTEAGLPLEEARKKAIAAMGDPHETGQALAKVHTPWLSLLLTGSMSLFLLTLLLAFQLLQSGKIVDHFYAVNTALTEQEIAYMKSIEAQRQEQPGFTEIDPCTLWEGSGYTITLDKSYIFNIGYNELLWVEISMKRRPWHPLPLGVYKELAFYDGQGDALDYTSRFIDRDTMAYTVRLKKGTPQVTVEYTFGQAAFSHLLKEVTP